MALDHSIFLNNIFYYSWNFLEMMRNLNLTNGGKLVMDEIAYTILNTCTIDYFLLVVFFLGKNSKGFENEIHLKTNKNFKYNFFKIWHDIYLKIQNNNWNMARLIWAQFNKFPEFKLNEETGIKVDYFGSLYQAYMKMYYEVQEFNYYYKCPDDKCVLSTKLEKSGREFQFK